VRTLIEDAAIGNWARAMRPGRRRVISLNTTEANGDRLMTTTSRHASTIWGGDLKHGTGTVNSASEALRELPVTYKTRVGRPDDQTSPEELIAAAHASCFSMALADLLAKEGHPSEHLDVSATVTLDDWSGPPTIMTSQLAVTGRVPGIDSVAFRDAARRAGAACPVSRALAAVDITVNATLAQPD
jgi:lipoyl-dependent peroxiredoxin